MKNAAGFDIPKFLVGSCGRFGVITEVTFKVFPAPQSWLTLRIPCATATEAADRIAQGASSRWEFYALDFIPDGACLYARIGGPAEANAALADEIKLAWPGTAILTDADANAIWSGLREFTWAHADGVLAKIPLTLATLASAASAIAKIPGARAHFSAAGNVAYVSLPASDAMPSLEAELRALRFSGLVLRGDGTPLRIGTTHEPSIAEDVRAVFDPARRFAILD